MPNCSEVDFTKPLNNCSIRYMDNKKAETSFIGFSTLSKFMLSETILPLDDPLHTATFDRNTAKIQCMFVLHIPNYDFGYIFWP
jgi:hypothetical protein